MINNQNIMRKSEGAGRKNIGSNGVDDERA